ncbi:MAG: twin-arginine translocation signal domain-containing protein, partial [Rubripirellula sp.]
MPSRSGLPRRDFLQTGAAIAGGCLLGSSNPLLAAPADAKTGWLRKTLK